MIRVSEIAEHWFGLCRKPPVVPTSQEDMVNLPESVHVGIPEGGGGGSGAIRRGIGTALSGMRTLNRNRQLLWFTFLAGLVLAGNIICQGALWCINWIMGGFVWLVLGFFIEVATLFCLVFLLAGLVRSISSGKKGHASFFAGLAGAKKYKIAIFLWSFVLAFAGMLLSRIFFYPGGIFWPFSSYLLNPLIQYPFTLNLNPSTFAEIPGYGGRSPLFWTYPYGFENAPWNFQRSTCSCSS
jgi:hypothetical protein